MCEIHIFKVSFSDKVQFFSLCYNSCIPSKSCKRHCTPSKSRTVSPNDLRPTYSELSHQKQSVKVGLRLGLVDRSEPVHESKVSVNYSDNQFPN